MASVWFPSVCFQPRDFCFHMTSQIILLICQAYSQQYCMLIIWYIAVVRTAVSYSRVCQYLTVLHQRLTKLGTQIFFFFQTFFLRQSLSLCKQQRSWSREWLSIQISVFETDVYVKPSSSNNTPFNNSTVVFGLHVYLI